MLKLLSKVWYAPKHSPCILRGLQFAICSLRITDSPRGMPHRRKGAAAASAAVPAPAASTAAAVVDKKADSVKKERQPRKRAMSESSPAADVQSAQAAGQQPPAKKTRRGGAGRERKGKADGSADSKHEMNHTTLFVRNLSFDTTSKDVRSRTCAQHGRSRYAPLTARESLWRDRPRQVGLCCV